MKRLIAVAVVSGLVGFAAGNAFWYLASPLWIDRHVAESASAAQTAAVLAQGSFQGADSVHKGRGQATLFAGSDGTRLLRFTDFEVTNGPDLEVWLVGKADIASAEDVLNSEYLPLGQLKGNIGDQNYGIPADADLSNYRSVVIWCEQFGVLFAAASLGQ